MNSLYAHGHRSQVNTITPITLQINYTSKYLIQTQTQVTTNTHTPKSPERDDVVICKVRMRESMSAHACMNVIYILFM